MSPQVLILLFVGLFITFLILFMIMHKRKAVDSTRLPPSPKKLPIVGNLHQLGKLFHRSLDHLAKKNGPLILLQLGSAPTLVVSSADMVGEIFKNLDLAFSGRPNLYAAKKITYDLSSVSFACYGEYWREMKKNIVLELLSAKRVQSFKAIRHEEVASVVNTILSCSPNMPVNMSKLAFTLSNNVVCRVAFGRSHDGSKFHQILQETQNLLGEPNIADFFPWMAWFNKFNGMDSRLEKNFRELDGFFDKLIQEHLDPRRNKAEHDDLVDVFLRIQGDPTQTTRLTNENIKGVLTDILVAGTDTSAATLVWTMAELIRNPMVKRKAQQEVREIIKGKREVEETDLSKLSYLKLVIKESLRLHPPAPVLVPRETLETCIIGGFRIPAKTRVFINAASIATDPTYWENPLEFKPERFSNSSVDFRGQNFELIPFGAGRRSCPGINFSVPLIELALANLLLQFEWSLPEGTVDEGLDMEEALGITMHKKTPLVLIASSHKFV